MAIPQFNHLTEDERVLLYSTPALVTYLIGGADGDFDTKEEVQSEHVVRIRTANGDPLMFDFFKHVEQTYFDQLDATVKKYGNLSVAERTELIVNELTKLNVILPKVDELYARVFLKSLRSLAKTVAEASGGVMGFLEVSYEEEHLMGLNMITYNP
jgi:hypothetical protein